MKWIDSLGTEHDDETCDCIVCLYRKEEREAEKKHPPKFCPNCGKPLGDTVEYYSHCQWPETPDHPHYGIGYDCYCTHCKWSGDIEPDEDDMYGYVKKR
jgi:hypothetical protein